MNCSSTRQAKMNKENTVAAKVEERSFRITRARAKVLGTSGGILSSKISIKQDQKRVLQTNAKRAASDENKLTVTATADHQHKKRAVLKDVTNVLCESSYTDCINAAKFQSSKWAKRGPAKKSAKVAPSLPSVVAQAEEPTMSKTMQRITQTKAMELPGSLKENVPVQQNSTGSIRDVGPPDLIPVNQTCRKFVRLASPSNKEEDALCDKLEVPNSLVIADIDTKQKDPQMCSMYAPDIYNNIRATELERRPSADFMETVQQDITQSMRGILIDWLVEVSEEYKLVPDTIYLTVNLIDRFLSENYIEKQRLQLLGVTCMLIASKYEEICAPRIEEFCFITDNTYTKEEVLKMESQVLNFLHFQLSVPTTKTFLRRFIQAAQACYKVPSVELEFLANYLAELTLLDYDFIKFLPSLVAASAVFLARWTLDQSDHPWNPTLEHYTNYNAIELKPTVLALQDLQLNTKGGNLNAIREKYRQQKFKCIATLSPSEHVQSLF